MILKNFLTILIIGVVSGEQCEGEGLMPDHKNGCRDYYRCKGGEITGRYSCLSGLVFNAAARQCLPESRAPCIRNVCNGNDDKFYAAPGTQCQFYYKCEKGTALELTCPVGSWFDFKRQSCTKAAGVCYEAVCTGLVDGRYPDTTQSCERTLTCLGGNLIAVESPGLMTGEKCPSPRTTAVAFPITSSDHCSTLPDGSYAAPGAGCKDYIICENGETHASMRCPDGFRFNGMRCAPEDLTPCIDECATKEDGFYVNLSSGCHQYFYCQNRSILLRTTCSDGTVFDGQMCVPSSQYNCPIMIKSNPCLNKADGYYRDLMDCQSYFYCSNEEVTKLESCPIHQVWNGAACVSPSEFKCEVVQWTGCNDKPPGYYQDRTRGSDCKNYYYCSETLRINFACPENQIYNGEECVQDDVYTCPSLEKDSCDFKPNGYYQQTNGECRAYYMCSGGNKIIYLCDVNQVFDGKKCVDKNSYECPYRSNDCVGKSNGYHADVKTNCRKYYFCDSDEKITTLQCSGSKIFNGRGCVNQKDYTCPIGDSDPCAYKRDGFYVKQGTNCRDYYKCTGSSLVSQHQCPVGQVFDGTNDCAERLCAANTTCDNNGFYLDFKARCKKYYLCIDKMKTELECKDGQTFNGQLCVPEDSFICPEECSC